MLLTNFHLIVRIVFLAALGFHLLAPSRPAGNVAGVAALTLAILGVLGQ